MHLPNYGCPEVVHPRMKHTYQLSMTGVGFATHANTSIKALQAANTYCDKLGKHRGGGELWVSVGNVHSCMNARVESSNAWRRVVP